MFHDHLPRDALTMSTATPSAVPASALLAEVAWEVCNQIGGIYTVVRSKVPDMVRRWGERYCLVGPYEPNAAQVEFEEVAPTGPFGRAAESMRRNGLEARFGRWLVTGHPLTVLLSTQSVRDRLPQIRRAVWERDGVDLLKTDTLVDDVLAFGFLVEAFLTALRREAATEVPIVAHIHEWMAGTAISALRRSCPGVSTVFTTHATLLGRFLAMSDARYFDAVPRTDWLEAARRFNIEQSVRLERAAANAAHVLTTVSEITAFECEHLLGRKPDVLVPNGLNIERFAAPHEFQSLHRTYKERLHEFVTGYFFPSYSFDLDRTLYCFTSGRYEYGNKGFDLTIEALARLNWRMKHMRMGRTVVCFLVTRAATRSVQAEVLRTSAVMEEIRRDCQAIERQVGQRLFSAVTAGRWPALGELVDEYWRLRLRRSVQAWKRKGLPPVVTHDLSYPNDDAIYRQIQSCRLANAEDDPVKIVYHPDFIVPAAPLFGMDYDQFVRGCHLGVFPSNYEPWGYAPLECVALGLPTVTSNLAGFGTYVMRHVPDHTERGIHVLDRRNQDFGQAADALSDILLRFVRQERRERIAQRNQVEECAWQFDWSNLGANYAAAHTRALERLAGRC
jgi:glycogen(starch) synthase